MSTSSGLGCFASVLVIALPACRGQTRSAARSNETAIVSVRTPLGSEIRLDLVRWTPGGAVVRAERSAVNGVDLFVALKDRPRLAREGLTIEAPGACPTPVDLRGLTAEASIMTRDTIPFSSGKRVMSLGVYDVELKPWIDLGGDRAQLGFDAPFTLHVVPGCDRAAAGRIDWRQVSGEPLPELRLEQRGFRVRGRTAPLGQMRPGPLPWGIVSLSPRTRGQVVLEATWHGDGPTTTRRVLLSAAARTTGVPSLPPWQRVMLGGDGWRVRQRPHGGRADVEQRDGYALFIPDAEGTWKLEDARGKELRVGVRRHDRARLDCGRSECHPEIATAAAPSAMTRSLFRILEGEHGKDVDPSCAVSCHAASEPGLPDGGLWHVAWEDDLALPRLPKRGAWSSLPRSLRRVGSVGCTTCHGPGHIPASPMLWSILRVDVCAVCHDAPPRYRIVEDWRHSRMATTDLRPGAIDEAACGRCHSTDGFLSALGVLASSATRSVPRTARPLGIACAACHAVHGEDVGRSLVRRVSLPDGIGALPAAAEASGICVSCHFPDTGSALPAASAAALWLGRGGVAVFDGEPLSGRAPHLNVEGGCVGCHGGSTGHQFAVDRDRCRGCHADGVPEPTGSIRARAESLWLELISRDVVRVDGRRDEAPHAAARCIKPVATPEARAAWNVALVLEDRAAMWHNAEYARRLLDQARVVLTETR
ncbi:MAG: hypothetical protein V3T05_01300 [Myxococcota bacterium]